MRIRRTLFSSTFLSGIALVAATASVRAADLTVDTTPPTPTTIDTTQNYDTVYFGLNNPSQVITISSGADLGAASSFIGYNAASDNNIVTVTGGGTSWMTIDLGSDGDNLHVGLDGSNNRLNVLETATVSVGHDMLVGSDTGADNNSVVVAGGKSELAVTSTLYVGRSSANNSVRVEDGGILRTTNARIGGGTGSNGAASGNSVTITGEESSWILAGTLRIGDASVNAATNNTLTVDDGASVIMNGTNKNTFIGVGTNASGNKLEVKNDASFTTDGNILVGAADLGASDPLPDPNYYFESSNSQLLISNGGSVSTTKMVAVGSTSSMRLGYDSSLSANSLLLRNGSTLGVTIDETAPSSIDIDSTATLDGTLDATIGADSPTHNNYSVLHAGSVSGTFDTLNVTGLSPNFSASMAYTATDALVHFNAEMADNNKLNHNQTNVAKSLDGYFNRGGVFSSGFADLYDLTGKPLSQALTSMTGEVGASGGAMAVERATNSFLDLMLSGYGTGGAGMNGGGGARMAAAQANGDGVMPTADAPPASAMSVWGSVYGGTAGVSGDSGTGSHETDTGLFGIATGWDYAVTEETLLGVALAGGGTSWDLGGNLGSGDSTFLQFGGYGTQHFGQAYLSVAAAYAWHSMSTERKTSSVDPEKLKADFNANNLSGRLEGGYRFGAEDSYGFTPYAAIQAQAVYLPGYDEDGGEFALSYDGETATSTRSELGIWLDSAAGTTANAARVYGRLAWAHDWNSDGSVNASFQSLHGANFTVTGAEAPANIALVTLGADVRLTDATRLAANFDGEFADGYSNYEGSLKLGYSW